MDHMSVGRYRLIGRSYYMLELSNTSVHVGIGRPGVKQHNGARTDSSTGCDVMQFGARILHEECLIGCQIPSSGDTYIQETM